ncbi:hypothetical protein BN1723_007317 [Verticillium longisporum]|uniref:Uncharacterized protein n=1 Tax=Verticillium longisporum TaxID=100787 RepID=A0A0G4NKU8_VERLO|nr:hypothetical protein BN1723_007317 [Verticillium longisporum]
MQKSGTTPTSSSTPFFSSSFFSSSSTTKSRPGTASGDPPSSSSSSQLPPPPPPPLSQHNTLTKDRKGSFGRKTSFSSPSKTSKRRANSSSGGGFNVIVTDSKVPPALPDFALAAAAKIAKDTDAIQSPASADSFSKMLGRTPTGQSSMNDRLAAPLSANAGMWAGSEAAVVHLQIQELAKKRMATLEYLRKAHESRVYWFNTVVFERSDLQRFPYFDPRKLARRATNYLLLGLSLPTVADLNSNTPLDFLRSLNVLLQEFESFQQLHGEAGSSSSSLSRARLPQMFRRGPVGKSRRSNSGANDIGVPMDDGMSGGIGGTQNANVVNFAHSETDLLPGEEYTLLLTPALPFEPDYFETFATLCDVLIDTYTKLLSLMPTPAVATAPVGELFSKVDGRVRKIIVQGAVKEFEDQSRAHAKTEMANISPSIGTQATTLSTDTMSGLFGSASSSSASNTVGDLKSDAALSNPPEDTVSDLAFSPATNQTNDFLAISSWDKKVRIYEVTGNGQSEGRHAYDHEGPVFNVDFSKDGTKVISGGADKVVKCCDLGSRQEVKVGEHDQPTLQSPLKWQTRVVSCFTDAAGFAIGSIEGRCAIQYVEDKDSSLNFSFKCHRDPPQNNITNVFAVNDISFHPVHGTFSTAGSDGTFHFWDKDAKHRLKGYPNVGGSITSTKFNKNGSIFAYAVGYDWSKGFQHNTQQLQTKVMLHPVQQDECKPRPTMKKR